jgi:2-oxoglutarate dehydrogenase E2 component (dihydrolipoamide succinyltransferase)
MSDRIKITLPKLGESIVSATIVQWFKKVGDACALDEPLLEVSTDKVNSEIPAPAAGTLLEILAEPNQEVEVGAPLAILSTQAVKAPSTIAPSAAPSSSSSDQEDLLTPSVLRLLKEKGISLQDIDRIPHTGQGGRLTKKDVEDYCAAPQEEAALERVKMTAMRKAIAENMVRSFYEAPHASLITEIDVTGIVGLIKDHKESYLKKTGVKLTITSFAARAIARAIQAYPLINSSLENDTIVVKRFVNLGVAVSVDQGVMVPVIRNCQQLSIDDISRRIAELAEKARGHTLTPEDVKDGTITMTNFGMTGTQIGIPIIRFPEVAIVGLGAITKRVKVMPDDTTAIRSIMMVSLTFDHRVLDGLYGCGFLNELKKHLEEDLSL